jgi:hypothetical protein
MSKYKKKTKLVKKKKKKKRKKYLGPKRRNRRLGPYCKFNLQLLVAKAMAVFLVVPFVPSSPVVVETGSDG